MDPISVVFVAAGVGIAYFMYRSGQMTSEVPPEHQVEIPEDGLQAIEYFWRPGCPFCARLGSSLQAENIPTNSRNIWENPDDAAVVRSIADGNETVPTVIIGPLGMVNPTIKQVKAALEEHAPHLL